MCDSISVYPTEYFLLGNDSLFSTTFNYNSSCFISYADFSFQFNDTTYVKSNFHGISSMFGRISETQRQSPIVSLIKINHTSKPIPDYYEVEGTWKFVSYLDSICYLPMRFVFNTKNKSHH
jgi:hypothetical protein